MAKSLNSFLDQIKEYENGHALDLSSSEDLSIAVMNLVSIEEHLFFTSQKTENRHYLELMNQVRQIRKKMQGYLVKDTEGEVWCICKHLLGASMRLMETGNKLIVKDKHKAYDFYDNAYQLYNLFWLLNLKLIKTDQLPQTTTDNEQNEEEVSKNAPESDDQPNNSKIANDGQLHHDTEGKACKLQPFSKVLSEQLDCCKE